MAKFKVGDKVEITSGSKSGKLGTVESSAPGPMGGEMYHVRLEDGSLTDAAERNLLAANSAPLASTNAVVQNAINARRARNADGDGAAVKAIRDLQRRIAPLAREAEAMRGKFIANKWYGYDAALEFIAKRLKEAEAEGKW